MKSLSGSTGRLLFVLLVAAWALPGTVGRTPWKADEAYTYGLVWNIMETGDWVVPQLGGEPFMQKPPLFFIVAAVCGKLFSGVLGLDTAIRLAVVLFQIATLICLGVAAREQLGPGKGWYAPALFMGCLGFVQLSHMLITDVALVTGVAMAFTGLAFTQRRPVVAGILLGTGSGVAFMSKGLLGPGLIGLTVMLLPVCFRAWRTKGFAYCLGAAAVASLPWVFLWPLVLYHRSPELFNQWFLDNNLGRFVGPALVGRGNSLGIDDSRYNFFVALPWFAWPAFPLACLMFWRERRAALRQPGVQLGLVGLLVILVVLSLSRNSRTLYGLPMLVPACLLGARGVGYVTERWTNLSRSASGVVFGAAALAAWVVWLVQFTGPAGWWHSIQKKVPDYQPEFHFALFAAAFGATLLWAWWMWRQPRADHRTVAVNWCAGLSLGYLIAMTLFLPVAESNMSYRQLAPLREVAARIHGPVISSGLSEPQRAMVHYYAGLKTHRLEVDPQATGDWLMTATDVREPRGTDPKGAPWELVWETLHSRKELFRLYRRTAPGVTLNTGQP